MGSPVEVLNVVNELLDISAITTTTGMVKCWTPDNDEGGLCKTYLDAKDCDALAAAFAALATHLREQAPAPAESESAAADAQTASTKEGEST